MRCLIAGDVHGDVNNIQSIFNYACEMKCERIFQVGDLGYGFPNDLTGKYISQEYAKTNIPFYFVKGNHDNHELLKFNQIEELSEGFFFIPNSVPFDVDGVTFMGEAVS